MQQQCITSYAFVGFWFTMAPLATFHPSRDDTNETIYFYLYWFLLLVMTIICTIINSYNLEDAVNRQAKKSEKMKVVRIGLCFLLLCILIQHSILYYSFHYLDSSDAIMLMTLKWTSCILGLLSVLLVAIIGNQSNCFFHPTDILDIWLFIGTFIGSLILCGSCYVSMAIFVPGYVFVIKALLQVFFDSKRIMDLSNNGQNNLVVFRTWWGTVYRGKPISFYSSLYINFSNVEKRVGKNDWRRTKNSYFLYFNIIWINMVPNKQKELQLV